MRGHACPSYSLLVLLQGCVEIAYITVQTVMFVMVVYWMCWFQIDAGTAVLFCCCCTNFMLVMDDLVCICLTCLQSMSIMLVDELPCTITMSINAHK